MENYVEIIVHWHNVIIVTEIFGRDVEIVVYHYVVIVDTQIFGTQSKIIDNYDKTFVFYVNGIVGRKTIGRAPRIVG